MSVDWLARVSVARRLVARCASRALHEQASIARVWTMEEDLDLSVKS